MASKQGQPLALSSKRPKDRAAAAKLDRLMSNAGLSPEMLGVQTGVSGKRIRQIVDDCDEPQRRVKYALARRFDLLPADIWKSDRHGLTPADLEHLRGLARRSEELVA
jgi:hypothetical protein